MTTFTEAQTREIVRRRFGSDHAKPCLIPTVTTCALWACQVRDRCQRDTGERPVANVISLCGRRAPDTPSLPTGGGDDRGVKAEARGGGSGT